MLKTTLLIAWHGVLALGSWMALFSLSRLWGRWDCTAEQAWRWGFLAAMGIGLIEAWVIAALVVMR
jgi:hypothetical protein